LPVCGKLEIGEGQMVRIDSCRLRLKALSRVSRDQSRAFVPLALPSQTSSFRRGATKSVALPTGRAARNTSGFVL
jgi:hypothetical protein